MDSFDTSVTKLKIDVKDKSTEIASWGKKNDYPQAILKQVRLNGSASSGLRFLRKAHYGNGLVLVLVKFGKSERLRILNPKPRIAAKR